MKQLDGKPALPLPMEEEQVLMPAMLYMFLDWPECKTGPVSWNEMAQRQPEPLQYSPEVLQFYTYRCANDGFLSDFSREGDTFQIGGVTSLGKRMLRDEFAFANFQASQMPSPGGIVGAILVLIGMALRVWFYYESLRR